MRPNPNLLPWIRDVAAGHELVVPVLDETDRPTVLRVPLDAGAMLVLSSACCLAAASVWRRVGMVPHALCRHADCGDPA